jgi:homoserine O-acetyltransferase
MVSQFRHNHKPYPTSGAWMPGDPIGHRQFHVFANDRPFSLEGGGSLSNVTVAYETWGTLNSDASNAILVCHAWTGDSHVTGPASDGHPTPGWWEGVVGPGHAIDTSKYFVVCANVLGGCQGSTGPASLHPDDGLPYGLRFPVVTIRDMVRAQASLADALGIRAWRAVVGGSMGGMQALEWAIMFPSRVRALAAIATSAAASAQQIAWGSIGRRSLLMDPNYNNGDYYNATDDQGPWYGLSVARMVELTHVSTIVLVANSVTAIFMNTVLTCSLDSAWRATSTITATNWCADSMPTVISTSAKQWICTTSGVHEAVSTRLLRESQPQH